MSTGCTMNKRHHPSKLFLCLITCFHLYGITFHHLCDAFSLPQQTTTHHRHHRPTTVALITSSFVHHRISLIGDARHKTIHQNDCHTSSRYSNKCSNVQSSSLFSVVSEDGISTLNENGGVVAKLEDDAALPITPWIIQWRGEGTEGYSEALRQLEFTSAFRAEMADYIIRHATDDVDEDSTSLSSPLELKRYLDNVQFNFQDALTYHGPIFEETNAPETDNDGGEYEGCEAIPLAQVGVYESAMQYTTISLPTPVTDEIMSNTDLTIIDQSTLSEIFQTTIQRCSLIRTAFQIVSEGESYEDLAMKALDNHSFEDIMEGGVNADATWSIRLRRYGPMEEEDVKTHDTKKSKRQQARYGKNVRSPLRDERKAIISMAELVDLFRGKVDLANPECRIYLLEGLKPRCDVILLNGQSDSDGNNSKILLARVIAQGPKTSIYAPKTRICITTTPLCPIASFTLCNIAQLQRHQNPAILDPFAGSCATLLAAAHITTSMPTTSHYLSKLQSNSGGCRSIAIEISHNGYVNKDDIVEDFVTRSLPPPSKIIRGDCLSSEVRDQARMAIGGTAFDAIVTDPPYGIREAMGSEEESGNIMEGDASGSESSISPLTKLFYAMGQDRSNGTPLLKSGGRLVAFVPVRKGESLDACVPDLNARKEAGLVMEGEGKEQVLSDILSRWLVSFVCV